MGRPPDALVVEVSSYQLQLFGGTFAPGAAAVLNLTADHLERHGTLEAYGRCKCNLFRGMGPEAFALLPAGGGAGGGVLRALAAEAFSAAPCGGPEVGYFQTSDGSSGGGGGGGGGGSVNGGDFPPGEVRAEVEGSCARIVPPGDRPEVFLDLGGLRALGAHNRENAAVAAFLALALPGAGASAEGLQAEVEALEPPPHRMQQVPGPEGGGDIQFVDDSKATNLDAAEMAIRSIERPAVVLLGGLAKRYPGGEGLGFGRLAPLLARHRTAVTFGADGPAIQEELRAAGAACDLEEGLEDALKKAKALARPGDAVLLSPGCASFDSFDSFEHRGRVFAALCRGERC